MNTEHDSSQSTFTIIASLFREDYSAVAAYVAVTANRVNSSYVTGYMDCAIEHHELLSRFEGWEHADRSHDHNIPIIIVW